MINKSELRSYYKNIRNSITAEKRKRKSNEIYNNFKRYVSEMSIANCFQNYFVYDSFGSEADTHELISWLCEIGKNVTVPKCDTATEEMYAVVYEPDRKNTVLNEYGIYEPKSPIEYKDEIEVIIAPGIVFDRCGNRIGFGKGYYDKFTASLKKRPLIIALAFSEQIAEKNTIPSNEFDVKMDVVITEKEVIAINELLV